MIAHQEGEACSRASTTTGSCDSGENTVYSAACSNFSMEYTTSIVEENRYLPWDEEKIRDRELILHQAPVGQIGSNTEMMGFDLETHILKTSCYVPSTYYLDIFYSSISPIGLLRSYFMYK